MCAAGASARSATSPASRSTPPRAWPAARAGSSRPRPTRRPSGCGCCAPTASPATRGSGPARARSGHYDVVEPGFKANLADLQAAVALPKIDRLESLPPPPQRAGRPLRRGAAVAERDRADRAAGLRPPRPPPVRDPDRSRAGRSRPRRLRRRAHGRERLHRPALPARAHAHLVPPQSARPRAAGDRAGGVAGAVAAAGGRPLALRHRRRRRGGPQGARRATRGEDQPAHPRRGGGGRVGGRAGAPAALGRPPRGGAHAARHRPRLVRPGRRR